MAFSLPLPKKLANQWSVKIRDKERLEPPHVTIMRGTRAWRLDLRTGELMDKKPDPSDVPPEVTKAIESHWAQLQREWDEMYPENKVQSEEVEADD